MMGGTELIMKKDQNLLESELVREDWMNKPEEEMTEDERQKLREFEQKEKDFKEKQRKAWEKDLEKVKGEIISIQLSFQESLLQLYKKRLFYDVRIMEQELYIIRLIIMLHDTRETKADCIKFEEETNKLLEDYEEKERFINNCSSQLAENDLRLKDDKA